MLGGFLGSMWTMQALKQPHQVERHRCITVGGASTKVLSNGSTNGAKTPWKQRVHWARQAGCTAKVSWADHYLTIAGVLLGGVSGVSMLPTLVLLGG